MASQPGSDWTIKSLDLPASRSIATGIVALPETNGVDVGVEVGIGVGAFVGGKVRHTWAQLSSRAAQLEHNGALESGRTTASVTGGSKVRRPYGVERLVRPIVVCWCCPQRAHHEAVCGRSARKRPAPSREVKTAGKSEGSKVAESMRPSSGMKSSLTCRGERVS